ncbi:DMT family transporter [Xanthobacter pseudotagetidis]|uniref:DMT family transporter n=1 Tax=Xanthobacter pseudotagetidis TaxID=3119911 RepID=UPI0037290DCF
MSHPSREAPLSPTDWTLYVASVLIFGLGWLPMRLQLGVVAPEISAFWRFVFATPVMFALVFATRSRLVFGLRDHALFLGLGACLFSCNFLSFYYAGYHLPSGLISVVFSLVAIIIPLLSALLLGAPLRRALFLGALLGIAGTALVFGPSVVATFSGASAGAEAQAHMGMGLLLALIGTCCFSVGSILSGVAGRRGLPLLSMTAFSFAYGLCVLGIAALVGGSPFILEMTPRYLGSLAFLVVGPTLSGFGIYLALVRRIGASRAGYGTVLYPLIALALSTFFEDYHWTWSAAFGIALVLIGNMLVLRAPAPAKGG